MKVTTGAIDLAKNVFAVCGANAAGKVIWRKELRRGQLLGFMRKLAPCLVGMEACGGRTTGRANSSCSAMTFVWSALPWSLHTARAIRPIAMMQMRLWKQSLAHR